MSTHSHIGMEESDGRIRFIYCHFDGYLNNNGKILLTHYQNPEKISGLLDLGDLSSMGESIEDPEGLEKAGIHCRAYHRDLGEELAETKYANNVDDFLQKAHDDATEYIYLYINGKWVYTSHADRSFKEFTLEDCLFN